MKKRIVFYSVLAGLILSASSCKKEEETAKLPSITTTQISAITKFSAISGGTISSNGGDWVSARGVCWSTEPNPTIKLSTKTINGSGNGMFVSNISGLSNNVTYHVRAYATNTAGTAYGDDITFTTTGVILPTITTNKVSNISETSATCSSNVTSNGGEELFARGVCWSKNANPTIIDSKTTNGTGEGAFVSEINGLSANEIYHVRAYATNSAGTAYGLDIIFVAKTGASSTVDNDNMMLGNPSGAIEDVVSANNYLMVKPYYCLSYNNSKHIPNWTSWHLYSGDIGDAGRTSSFSIDSSLPSNWTQSTDYDFSTSGFERGHMCPSADRELTAEINATTFVMTNCVPQSPNNNGQTWANLESYCRTLVSNGNELFIIAGPNGQGGTSRANNTPTNPIITVQTVGPYNTVVPAYTWKIIVVLPNGNNDLSRITSSTRVIAVKMPNTVDCNTKPWTDYRVSVDELETLTEYDFLSNVSGTVQDIIEAKVDNL